MNLIKTSVAAERLGVTSETIRAYCSNGWLTPQTPKGERGRGRRMYFDEGEVEAFKAGMAAGAAAWRLQQERPMKARKPRGKRAAVVA